MRTTTWEYVAGKATHPAAVWRAWAGLHWADYDARGCRVAQGTDLACTPTADELAAWDAEAPVIVARAANAVHPAYIRWGDLPRGGRSRNHASGQLERGTSVYRARYNPATDCYDYDDDALAGAALTYLIAGATAYLVTGREVGRGADGEPLLADVRIVATLIPCADGFRIDLH